MPNWLVILITVAVFVGILALAVFMWTHRASRLTRAVSDASNKYNQFVGMGVRGPLVEPPSEEEDPDSSRP